MYTSRSPGRGSGTAVSRAAALLVLLLAAVLLVSGCGSSADSTSSGSDRGYAADKDRRGPAEAPQAGQQEGSRQDPAATPAQGSGGTGRQPADVAQAQAPRPQPSHVIRTATLRVRVRAKNLTDAVDHARQITEDADGYVGSESTERDKGTGGYSRMVLRIPPDRYEESLDDLARLGRVLERSASAKDVTDEVVDIESRIRTQRASVNRVRKLMDRAEEIGDIVTLESELRTRQADLESMLAQQKSLASRTGMTTVTLTLTERAAAKKDRDEGVGTAVLDALGDGWHAFYVALRGLLVVLAAALPFAVVLVVLYLLLRRFFPRPARPTTVGPPASGPTPPPTVPVTAPGQRESAEPARSEPAPAPEKPAPDQ